MTVRRGFSIKENERILVVEDVITTGGSTRECITALEQHGAKMFRLVLALRDRQRAGANLILRHDADSHYILAHGQSPRSVP